MLEPLSKKYGVYAYTIDRYTNAAVNIMTDLIAVILPLPALNKLTLPTQQKASLLLVFGLGLVCAYFYTYLRVSTDTRKGMYNIAPTTDLPLSHRCVGG